MIHIFIVLFTKITFYIITRIKKNPTILIGLQGNKIQKPY